MKKIINNLFIIIFVFLVHYSAMGQYHSYTKFLSSTDTIGILNSIVEILETKDNNYLLYGDYVKSNDYTRFDIIKTDTSGNPLWRTAVTRSLLPNENAESYPAIIELPDSGFMIAGDYIISFNQISGIMRFDKNGTPVWSKHINATNSGNTVSCMTLLRDSTILISAERFVTPLGYSVSGYIKMDVNANILSANFYHFNCNTLSGPAAASSDGGFLHSLFVYPFTGSPHGSVGLIKYNSAGIIEWSKNYLGINHSMYMYDIKQLSNGNFLLCGLSNRGFNLEEGIVMCVDSAGNSLWVKKHSLFNRFQYMSISELNNGNILLSGYVTFPQQAKLLTVIDTAGSIINSLTFLNNSPYFLGKSFYTSDNNLITYCANGFGNLLDKKYLIKTPATAINICNSSNVLLLDSNVIVHDTLSVSFAPVAMFTSPLSIAYTYNHSLMPLQTVCTFTGIVSTIRENEFELYPNPAKSSVNISLPYFMDCRIEIADLSGRSVLTQEHKNQNKIEIDVEGVKSGIYIISIRTNSGICSKKLIVD